VERFNRGRTISFYVSVANTSFKAYCFDTRSQVVANKGLKLEAAVSFQRAHESGLAALAAVRAIRARSLLGGGGQADYYFGRVGVDIQGALREVAGAEVALYAAAPGANEREI